LSAFVDRYRELRELLGEFRLIEGSAISVGVDRGARDDDDRADEVFKREQLLRVLPLEGDEVDQDVRASAERLLQRGRVGAVDLDVLDSLRYLALAAAPDGDLPAALAKARDECAAGLAAAAEKKCPPRHGS
jgi:hypothetical protein